MELISQTQPIVRSLALSCLLGLISQIAFAQATPPLAERPPNTELKIEITDMQQLKGEGLRYSGLVTYSHTSPIREICFYLPYADPRYPYRTPSMARVLNQEQKTQQAYRRRGFMQVETASQSLEMDTSTPSLLRITLPDDLQSTISFHFSAFRAENQEDQEFILMDYFYPLPLSSCGTREEDMVGQLANAEVSFKGPQLAGYLALGPALHNSGELISLRGSGFHRLAFVWLPESAYHNLTVERFGTGNVYLQNSPTLPRRMLMELFQHLQDLFGPLPWPDLHVLNSNHLRRDDVPGFVFIHNAEEKGMQEMQWTHSHWGLWSAVYAGIRQWWGSALRTEHLADDWLSLGIST